MSKLFRALRELSMDDVQSEYDRIRKAVNNRSIAAGQVQSDSVIPMGRDNASFIDPNAGMQSAAEQPQEATPGLFAGLRRGITAEASPRNPTIPYVLGLLPGSILRSKLGLPVSEQDKIAEAIDIEKAKSAMQQSAEARNRADISANYPTLKPIGAEGGVIKYGENTPNLEMMKFQADQAEKAAAKVEKDREISIQEDKAKIGAQAALDTIGEVEKGIKYFGKATTWMKALPGTPKATWEANVNKLLAGQVIDVMQQMKAASKTGATGFGQLSNKELELLRNASTALRTNLKESDAKKYLNQMKQLLYKSAYGLEAGKEEDGYIYQGGDPSDKKNWKEKK